MTKLYLTSGEFLLFSRNHPVFLTRPTWGHLIYPTHSLDCASPTFASILCGFLEFLSSFLCVRLPPFRTPPFVHFLQGKISPHSLFHCMPTAWRAHILSAIFSYRKGSFTCTHTLPGHNLLVLVCYSTHVSSFCPFKRNNFVIFVSHPLNFPMSAASMTWFHFQRRKTAYTWFHQTLTFHPPRNIFTFVYHDVLPESLVC